ncbi:hypothetical protein R6Q59_019740 [Mikania micrantha]
MVLTGTVVGVMAPALGVGGVMGQAQAGLLMGLVRAMDLVLVLGVEVEVGVVQALVMVMVMGLVVVELMEVVMVEVVEAAPATTDKAVAALLKNFIYVCFDCIVT